MNRKTRGRRLPLAILVALVLIFSPCLASAYTYTFRAYIDGVADLIIQGNTVQWHNTYYEVPGFLWVDDATTFDPILTPLDCYDLLPTYISTVDMGSSIEWNPWSKGGGYATDYSGDQLSNIYTGLNLPLPASDQIVTLKVTEQRDSDDASVSIIQYPLLSNGYTLIVEFDDWVDAGAAWYTVEVTTSPVPLPGSLLFLGTGLLYLAHFRRRKAAARV